MQLIRTIAFISTALGLVGAAAVPVTKEVEIPPLAIGDGITTLLGPASYEELKAQVEDKGITKRELAKRNIGGLYLCDSE